MIIILIVSFFLTHRSVSFPVSRNYHSYRTKEGYNVLDFSPNRPTGNTGTSTQILRAASIPIPSRSPATATARDRRAKTLTTTTPRGWRGTGYERGRKKKEHGRQWPVVVVVSEFLVPVRVFFFEYLPFHSSLRVEDRSEQKCVFGVLPIRSDPRVAVGPHTTRPPRTAHRPVLYTSCSDSGRPRVDGVRTGTMGRRTGAASPE